MTGKMDSDLSLCLIIIVTSKHVNIVKYLFQSLVRFSPGLQVQP